MLEVGANVSNTHASGGGFSATRSYVQPNAKYKVYANDDQGVAVAAGVVGYFAMNHRSDLSDFKDFAQFYGEASKKFKAGARVTGGVWGSAGLTDNKAGVLAGYEQPITAKVSFVADWFSGKNFWGSLTPGISVTLPHNGLLNVGYSIGNDAWNSDPGNNKYDKALFIYYGVTFP